MERVPIVGGNWKMHTNRAEADALLRGLRGPLAALAGVEVVLFPPAPWLAAAHDAMAGTAVAVGAQHLHWQPTGAFTGEVSSHLVEGIASWVLIGHSERRQHFGETEETTSLRLRAAIAAGLQPVLAIGEALAERESGATVDVLRRQLLGAVEGLDAVAPGFVIAYEPVWAIGTGVAATPEIAQETCAAIRALVAERFDAGTADACRIQYGGSVNASNIASYAAAPDVDGALVGGASLDAAAFAEICARVAAGR